MTKALPQTSQFGFHETPNIQQLGAFLSRLNDLDTFIPAIFESGMLGSHLIEASSFRESTTSRATRADKQGWYGELINKTHALLRIKAMRLNQSIMGVDSAFAKQLDATPTKLDATQFKRDYTLSLQELVDEISTLPEPISLPVASISTLLADELNAINALNPEKGVSLLFAWQRLQAQQKIFAASNKKGVSEDLKDNIHGFTSNGDSEALSKQLRTTIRELTHINLSLVNPENNTHITIQVPPGSGKAPFGLVVLGLASGEALLDVNKVPYPMQLALEPIGRTTDITAKWQSFNDAISIELSKQIADPKLRQNILEANGFTLSGRDMKDVQTAAAHSLQELNFINRIIESTMPDYSQRDLIHEVAVLAQSSAPEKPIAQTPRQLFVLAKIIQTATENSPNLPAVDWVLQNIQPDHAPPISALHSATGKHLLRTETAEHLKTQLNTSIALIAPCDQDKPVTRLLDMLKESLDANQSRHSGLGIA